MRGPIQRTCYLLPWAWPPLDLFNPTLSTELIVYKPTNIVFYEPINFFRVKSNSPATIFLAD